MTVYFTRMIISAATTNVFLALAVPSGLLRVKTLLGVANLSPVRCWGCVVQSSEGVLTIAGLKAMHL